MSAHQHIRRAHVRTEAGRILVRLESGFATEPLTYVAEIDAATALHLAGQLEAAVHAGHGQPEPDPARPSIATGSARPLPVFHDEQPINPS